MRQRLPDTVARTVDRYLVLLDRHSAPRPRGLYLVGSLALGDYQEGRSDIDFVALMQSLSAPEELDRLERVHAELAAPGVPPFDGCYLDAAQLRETQACPLAVPFSLDGRLRRAEVCFDANPVTWFCLARHGLPLLGPAPAELAIGLDEAVLRQFLQGNLESYWRGWIAHGVAAVASKGADDRMAAGTVAWGVLGIARIDCTLRTGRIVSKSAAGHWGLGAYPAGWRDVLQTALAARQGWIDQLPAAAAGRALDFMRTALDLAAQPEP
ncbi:aminoglycoside adenylyltransferase domain-containing protein [Geminicoccus flavidas]|uniref:aminoglycoside adenylyltransferase domain-containing protein n=1 Tax=Geminicoccus flavidas TaxID=2506407 RepID=UPI00135CE7DF|nr:aminoglycoside adenylyltransferase domain-containing protein [Geminicoccus flavidas]